MVSIPLCPVQHKYTLYCVMHFILLALHVPIENDYQMFCTKNPPPLCPLRPNDSDHFQAKPFPV